ncbi:MAG: hypothetical protein AAF125_25900 [Chloroflexota bacterium]
MTKRTQSLFFASYTFIATVAAVYLFIAIAIVPYWQTLSGTEIQAWFGAHFGNFATMMVPVHGLTILTTIALFVVNRKATGTRRVLWLVMLVSMLICEVGFSAYFGAVLNDPLSSGALEADIALATLDQWDTLHVVRTVFIFIALVCLIVLQLMPNETSET